VASALISAREARRAAKDLERQLTTARATHQNAKNGLQSASSEFDLQTATLKRKLDDVDEDERKMNEEFHQRKEAIAKRRRMLDVSKEDSETHFANAVTADQEAEKKVKDLEPRALASKRRAEEEEQRCHATLQNEIDSTPF
jgi:two-component sensor histidine kinase